MQHDIVLGAHDVTLVPLGYEHAAALLELVDDDLWAGLSTPRPRTTADVELMVLRAWESPTRWSFAVLDARTGEVRGSTSLYEVDRDHRRAVVGLTFYGRRWWGGPTNPATKLALLGHAFDGWGLHRVALRVDPANVRSVAAVERLGGVREGLLRGHRTTPDGATADSLSFSILSSEWPDVRAGLERRLAGAPAPTPLAPAPVMVTPEPRSTLQPA
ncbi:GNAT family protein [Actinotalea sp. AC32]|nr:GNAT family protein [Actinotalea sp. AC32]